MEAVFLKVLNMSLSASVLILVVLLLRLILRRVPKWIHCLLFAIVGVRLILPFSLKTVLSLIPSAEPIPSNIAVMPKPAVDTGIPVVNEAINPIITERFAPEPFNSVNPLQVVQYAASILWIVGIAGMLVFLLISWLRAKRSVRAAVRDESRAYLCDEVRTPFILGLFRPKIYLPSDITEETKQCVLLHERAHIKRGDPWWKLLAFLILSVHWFNPLCWLAYILFCRDIESACDESVIWWMPKNDVAAYSQALLDCGRRHRIVSVSPLAFGETNVKNRVRSVLRYKRPLRWAIIASVVILAIVGVCFLTNPKEKTTDRKWTGDGHWYTFAVYDSSMSTLISSTNMPYDLCSTEYRAANIEGVAIGRLKGANKEYKVYTADPKERVIWFDLEYDYVLYRLTYRRFDCDLPIPEAKNSGFEIGDDWSYRGILSLSGKAEKEMRSLLSDLNTKGEEVQCTRTELTDWDYVYLVSSKIPGLAYRSDTVIALYNGQIVLGIFDDFGAQSINGMIITVGTDSVLYREYDAYLNGTLQNDTETVRYYRSKPIFISRQGGLTDGTKVYRYLPENWHMWWRWGMFDGSNETLTGYVYSRLFAPSGVNYLEPVFLCEPNQNILRIYTHDDFDSEDFDSSLILISEDSALPDPFKEKHRVYLINDTREYDLELSEASSDELRDLYQSEKHGSKSIDKDAEEYGTLILRDVSTYHALCYAFADVRIKGENIWLFRSDTGEAVPVPQNTHAYAELMDIYQNGKLPQGQYFYLH